MAKQNRDIMKMSKLTTAEGEFLFVGLRACRKYLKVANILQTTSDVKNKKFNKPGKEFREHLKA